MCKKNCEIERKVVASSHFCSFFFRFLKCDNFLERFIGDVRKNAFWGFHFIERLKYLNLHATLINFFNFDVDRVLNLH